jgi:hypothetical protein
MVGKSYPMEEREDRNPVIKESFDIRMEVRQYELRIKALEKRVEELSRPHFGLFNIERVDQLEQSIVAIVERLEVLENKQDPTQYNTMYHDRSGKGLR